MSKTNTRGMKLYIAGEEVTKKQVEKLIEDYKKKIASPEYQEELKKFEDFMRPVQPKSNSEKT